MTIYISLFLALVGLAVYLLIPHAKLAEMGRVTFGVSLLVFLMNFTGNVNLLHK